MIPHTADGHEAVGGGETRAIVIYRSDRTTCGACSLKAQCLTAKQSTKKLTRGADDAIRDTMKAKVRSPEGHCGTRHRDCQRDDGISTVEFTRFAQSARRVCLSGHGLRHPTDLGKSARPRREADQGPIGVKPLKGVVCPPAGF